MDLITIDKEQLKKLFVEAYEAGWYGSKELASSTAEELVKRAAGTIGPTIDYPEGYVRSEVPETYNSNAPYWRSAADGTAESEDGNFQIEIVSPLSSPPTIEIEQNGRTINIVGWEVHWPSISFPHDDVGVSEE